MTYGSYPATRMSHPTFPRSLPHLKKGEVIFGTDDRGAPILLERKEPTLFHGYPYRHLLGRTDTLNNLPYNPNAAALTYESGNPFEPRANGLTNDAWATLRTNFLTFTEFITTSIGFADFGAGSNPHQELGWSGWSFPATLFDPISYGDGTSFFQDSATKKGVWKNFGDTTNDLCSIGIRFSSF